MLARAFTRILAPSGAERGGLDRFRDVWCGAGIRSPIAVVSAVAADPSSVVRLKDAHGISSPLVRHAPRPSRQRDAARRLIGRLRPQFLPAGADQGRYA